MSFCRHWRDRPKKMKMCRTKECVLHDGHPLEHLPITGEMLKRVPVVEHALLRAAHLHLLGTVTPVPTETHVSSSYACNRPRQSSADCVRCLCLDRQRSAYAPF